jgi:hypothetical protein
MGDGVTKKVALITLGDSERLHLEYVDKAAKRFKKGGYRVYVASPKRPGVGVHKYIPAKRAPLLRLIGGLGTDNDDDVIVLTTGHASSRGEICLQDGCYRKRLIVPISRISRGRMTYITTSCYGGNLAPYILNKPRTAFLSASNPGTKAFAPFFVALWRPSRLLKAKGADADGDGAVSWRERFQSTQTACDEMGLFLQTRGYRDFDVESGRLARRRFSNRPVKVSSLQSLMSHMRKLRYGEYAVIAFSKPNGTGSDPYRRVFNGSARKDDGRHLFIRVASTAKGIFKVFGITRTPAVLIVDGFGRTYRANPKRILASLALPHRHGQLGLPVPARIAMMVAGPRSNQCFSYSIARLRRIGVPAFSKFVRSLGSNQAKLKLLAIKATYILGNRIMPLLTSLLGDRDARARAFARRRLKYWKPNALDIPEYIKLLKHGSEKVLYAAAWVIAGFGGRARAAGPSLVPLLKHGNASVRKMARVALISIGYSYNP